MSKTKTAKTAKTKATKGRTTKGKAVRPAPATPHVDREVGARLKKRIAARGRTKLVSDIARLAAELGVIYDEDRVASATAAELEGWLAELRAQVARREEAAAAELRAAQDDDAAAERALDLVLAEAARVVVSRRAVERGFPDGPMAETVYFDGSCRASAQAVPVAAPVAATPARAGRRSGEAFYRVPEEGLAVALFPSASHTGDPLVRGTVYADGSLTVTDGPHAGRYRSVFTLWNKLVGRGNQFMNWGYQDAAGTWHYLGDRKVYNPDYFTRKGAPRVPGASAARKERAAGARLDAQRASLERRIREAEARLADLRAARAELGAPAPAPIAERAP